MKLNNKGFTLTEVLAVIIVLIAILTISLPDLSSTVEAVKNDTLDNNAFSYAELYVSSNLDAIKKNMGSNTSCYIDINSLYDYGYKVKENDKRYIIYYSNDSLNNFEYSDEASGNECNIDISDLSIVGSAEDLNSIENIVDVKYNLYDKVKLGDYVKMTPAGSLFKAPGNWEGVTIFNMFPNQTNLWRVIKKNDDRSIEMISNSSSSGTAQFKGVVGYKKYVYYLNEISKQFENENFTIRDKIRHLGFDSTCSVDEVINEEFVDDNYRPDPSSLSKTAGGKDECYNYDFNLISSINEDLTDKIDLGTLTWVSSRNYFIIEYKPYWCGRYLDSGGNLNPDGGATIFGSRYVSYGGAERHVRPIITLKNNVEYVNEDADGTSNKPYILG